MNELDTLLTTCVEGQPFAANYNPFYKAGGLAGHTGVDVNCGYASLIQALASGLVYSTYPINKPASDGYTAIFTLVQTPLETFEFSYGHVSEIDCNIGDTVKKGDIIGKEGNHGEVYSGNTLITLAMQQAGDQRGSHRHYQKRPVFKTQRTTGPFLYSYSGALYKDGYYQVYAPNNGFAGCVDWTAPLFPRDLFLGRSGYDVYLLQKAIVLEGCGSFTPTGTFGPLTLAGAIALQKKHNIAPTAGYVGLKTRSYLNATYQQLS